MRKRLLINFLYGIIFLLLIGNVSAENLYVTPNGAGNSDGSDWNNAFSGFSDIEWGSGSGELGAGDTLWIAGGIYSSRLDIRGSGIEGNPIIIKRARASDSECTSAAGWSNGFDSQVVINAEDGILIDSPSVNGPGRNVIIDGQVKDGIRINFEDVPSGRGIGVLGYGEFNTILRNIGSYGPSDEVAVGYPYNNAIRSLEVRGSISDRSLSNIVFDKMTFSGACDMALLQYASGVTIENSEIHTIEVMNNDVIHANLIYIMSSNDVIIRNNNFHDNAAGVGIFFTGFHSNGIQSSNFWIYGNIFRDTNMLYERFIEVRADDETITSGTGPLYIYNNVFVNGYRGIAINAPLNPESESYIRNNLFVDITSGSAIHVPGGNDYVTVSDNLILDSSGYDVFVDPGSTGVLNAPYDWQYVRDLHLRSGSSPINAGADLGNPFNIDMDGNVRGQDGAWDIGAYEYTGSSNPIHGECGATLNTCNRGRFQDTDDNSTHYRWICEGYNDGDDASCSLEITGIDGECGDAEGEYVIGEDFPEGSLCDDGDANPGNPSLANTIGATTSWQCSGSYGGNLSTCEAERVAIQECYDSSTSWQSFSFEEQNENFVFVFNATPSFDDRDSLLGLSAGEADSYDDLAVIVRFFQGGVIDARNGDSYGADRVINYESGQEYSFRIDVDMNSNEYDVYVDDVLLAQDFLFRSEQSDVESLRYWNIRADPTIPGSARYCGMRIDGGGTPCGKCDLDCNDVINMDDIMILISDWGSDGIHDMNSDGTVNLLDIMFCVSNW